MGAGLALFLAKRTCDGCRDRSKSRRENDNARGKAGALSVDHAAEGFQPL
jgi:hypothetical protein